MNRAIEQAGSLFTGWIHSCLFCPTGADDDSFQHDKSARQNGAEREMRVCHTQPHLVPPMKLVVYDDLPSPDPPPRVTSLPSWMMDGQGLRASRASNRTSTISFKKRTSTISFKKRSTAPIRISAPSDFRRVPLFATTTPGNPPALELSFNTPGHHLPELPHFEDFQLEENRRHTLTRPAKVLKAADTGRLSQARSHHRASSSVQLSRKPVGSGSRRSSLATLEQHLERSLPAPSPLIPHFSTRPSTVTGMTASLYSPLPTTTTTTRPDSTGIPGPAFTSDPPSSAIPEPQSPLQAHLQARPPLPPTDEDCPSSNSVHRPPTASSSSDGPANRTPPRTGRVTQWLFNTTSSSSTTTTAGRTSLPAFHTTWKPSFTADKTPFRLRSRTLSGSTLASSASTPSVSTANMTGAAAAAAAAAAPGNKITPSPSSSTTTFPRQTARPSEDYQPYPTIYESDDLRRSYYENQSHSHSPIGIAF